jgi:hypothetical protein
MIFAFLRLCVRHLNSRPKNDLTTHSGEPQSARASNDDDEKVFLMLAGDESPAGPSHRRHVVRRAGGAELIEGTDLRTLLTDGEQGFSFS